MDVYFSPLACSMATRIALDEAGAKAHFIEVDPFTHRMLEGGELKEIAPLALVPALRTDDGQILTENSAVLQYIGRLHASTEQVPKDGPGLARLQSWLSFVSTELHKLVFAPFLDRNSPEAVKSYALSKLPARLDVLNAHLKDREFLLDQFSVADAYLITVLNWLQVTPLKLADWPALASYATRMRARPSVARAIEVELPLYIAEQKRHAAS